MYKTHPDQPAVCAVVEQDYLESGIRYRIIDDTRFGIRARLRRDELS
jgi:hypothetical protein